MQTTPSSLPDRAVLLALLLIVPLPAGAETPDPDPTTSTVAPILPEIVVTARRGPKPVLEVNRTVHSLSREKGWQLQAQSLPEVFRETPGVLVQKTNRGAGAPILRGLVGPANLILIDGIRFNNSTFRTGPNQYLSLIDPESVERMEVMLGSGSVLYGSDAMGGVLQAFPVGPVKRRGFGGRAGLRFISSDASTAFWGTGSWAAEDGAEVIAGGAIRRFGTLVAGQGVEQPNSDYDQGSWYVRGTLPTSLHSKIGLSYFGSRIRNAGRVDRLSAGSFRFYDNDSDLVFVDWRLAPPEGTLLRELRVAVSFHRTAELVNRFRCSIDPQAGFGVLACLESGDRVRSQSASPAAPLTKEERNQDTVTTPGFLASGDLAFWQGRLRVLGGLELHLDSVGSSKEERSGSSGWGDIRLERGSFSEGSSYRSVGAFVHLEGDVFDIGSAKVVASAGGRVSNFSSRAENVPGVGTVEYDFTGLIGSLGLQLRLEKALLFYGSFAQGFRAPNLQETTVLGDTGSKFEVPNETLLPERSNTLELGARFASGALRLHGAAFLTVLDSLIDERELGPSEAEALGLNLGEIGSKSIVQRVNATSGTLIGAELKVELGPFVGFEPWGSVSWIRGEVDGEGGITPARRVPPLQGGAGIKYRWEDGGYVEAFSRFAGAQSELHPSDERDLRICENPERPGTLYSDANLNCLGTPGWATLNLRVGFEVERHSRFEAALLNLTDELYRDHGSGVDAPGLGLAISWIGRL